MQLSTLNLAQVLKSMILAYMQDFNNNCLRSKEFDDVALDKFINYIIYEGEKSALIRSLKKLTQVIDIGFLNNSEIKVDFIGEELEDQIPIFIRNSYNFITLEGKQLWGISIYYLDTIILKHVPRGLYKYSNFFKNVLVNKVYSSNVEISILDIDISYETYPPEILTSIDYRNELFGEVGIGFYLGKIEEVFRDQLLDFINNSKKSILIIEDKNYKFQNSSNSDWKICRGIRLYKLPDISYNKELLAINRKISKWGDMLYCQNEYENWTNYLFGSLAFEFAPEDEYLEIYATSYGFKLLFIDLIFDKPFHSIKLDISCPPCRKNDLILPIKIGASNNKLFRDVYIEIYENERIYK
ncbi:MAG TPA: hypothetical protein PKD00_09305 [Burkholderiales bacterium]|nr:hypothetical protein [Burkholderiales bacterium]